MRNLALVWVLAGVAVALLAAGDGKPSVSTFTDKRDGKIYKIVEIGSQIWFAENLNYAVEGSKCYNNKAENCAKYGRLYDWETALTACPAGTHLPTDEEWATLVDYAGGKNKAGTKLKSSTGWKSDEEVPAGTNDYGFSALPGGFGFGDGDFYEDGYFGFWWSATENTAYGTTKGRNIHYYHEAVGDKYYIKTYLFSVRCLQDDEKERRK
jgi:uncharacterized protein (TIGR02145 family)